MDRARALTRNKLRASSSHGASTRPRGCVSCRSGPSSRDLALSVTRTYDTLQNPAKSNVTYSQSLDEFVRVAINAYECGLMMDHLMAEGAAGEAEGRTIVEDFEGLTEVGLVWISISLARVPDRRWSKSEAVDASFDRRWRGFVKLISDAYFQKRMAWYPLQKLQLEQLVNCSRADPPDIIAERARIVFTTLRALNPQGY